MKQQPPRPPPNQGLIREAMSDELVELRARQYRRLADWVSPLSDWPWNGRFSTWLGLHRQSYIRKGCIL